MKTYWDLSEKERSELSEAGVEAFLGAELMTKGVLRVDVPKYDDEPEEALPPGLKVFRPKVSDGSAWGGRNELNVGFETEEQVRAFLALKPVSIFSEYVGGSHHIVARPIRHDGETELQLVEVHAREKLEEHRGQLEKREAIRKSNAAKRDQYEKEAKAQKEVLDGLWSDWLRCGRIAVEMLRILDTYNTYSETAGGDRETAFRFLRKVFTDDQILAAAEWHGFDAPGCFSFRKDRIEEICAAPAMERDA